MANDDDAARKRAREGFESWMGASPDAVLELASDDPPHTLDILVFIDDEGDDEPSTYLATVGLSTRPLGWGPGGAELLLCVRGEFGPKELEPLASQLGEVALALLTSDEELSPGAMLEVGPLDIFEGMTFFLISRWSVEEDTTLETDPPIHLLSINPIFRDEAMALDGMDEGDALEWLDEHGIDVDDPLRPSAVGGELSGADTMLGVSTDAAIAALSGKGSTFEMVSSMQKMIGNMETWLQENAPAVLDEIHGVGNGHASKLAPPPALEASPKVEAPPKEPKKD